MARVLPGVIALILGLGHVTSAAADSWSLPETTTYLSSDGRWRFTVTPRELSGQLAYFQDKVEGKEKAGARAGGNSAARGHMQQRTDKGWTTVWSKELLNDVAPVDVLVATSGQVATLDNWHTMGHGDRTIVVYDRLGAPVCSLALSDLFPSAVVESFPRSVSSIHWRKAARFSARGQVLSLTIAPPAPWTTSQPKAPGKAYTLGLRMQDCAVAPPAPDTWHEAIASAQRIEAQVARDRAEWREKFLAPLAAPESSDARAWHWYLRLAWLRVLSAEDEGDAEIFSLVPREQPEHEASRDELRDKLQSLTHDLDTLVVGCASPQDLLAALQEFATATPKNALRFTRIGLALPGSEFALAQQALRPTGVDLVQIDPSVPLPQSEENVRRLQESERERAAEIGQREQRARERKAWWIGY